MDEKKDNRKSCKYGLNCYQKNPEHLKKYKHPHTKEAHRDDGPSAAKKYKGTETCSESNKENTETEKIIIAKLPTNVKERIKILSLLEMPDDFYEFYEFCKSINSSSPKNALKSLNLELVGPFDILEGKLKDCSKDEALRHFRYYFDPPEFQTVLKEDGKDQLHFGYFRDDPHELPCFVAKNKALLGPAITCVAGNLFGAVNVHAEETKSCADIFRKMQMQKVQAALVKWAKQKKYSLDTVSPAIKARRGMVVTKTFNSVGLVVPYNKKTDLGYRSLPVSDTELNKLLKAIESAEMDIEKDAAWSKLQPVITAANIANDECDFGTSLELGLNMFAYGAEILHTTIKQLMCTSYKLLQRNEFADIIQAHLKQRRKDCNLSTIV